MVQSKEKRKNVCINRGLKQGDRQTKLRKREKFNGFEGAKNRGRANQRKKREN